ncbi:DUF4910 domain-containing protein [Thermoflavimicrobium dichotomicum]|uniref:Peptidase family M28 n=1 Tax=Thermoflavimicrobium dichotomicum TaxID=46223 RepID=A0A1I3TRS3_9BACL|nr:DUF4910 domain-containing protein [Thermoflavimicrobium dichotomicum]SFJ73964.1 Peptidase family M28 [Thermoflavimicrobium dichotomicum]
MFKKWIAPFRGEVSGLRALKHVQVISNYHRIQASPGYRKAAEYCAEQLQSFGLDAEIVRYPADPDVSFGNQRMFREWRCRDAELRLIHPFEQRLAHFQEMELSVIQRSTATPPEGITTELVVVERAEEEESYRTIDVRGKMVLARGAVHRIFDLAVKKHGAVGMVVDPLTEIPPHRSREDLFDAVQYTSFWWIDEPETGFGFVVSPRVGRQLRELCKKGPVTVFARVDAELVVGEMENVEAVIPGETDEEVLLVSHLCHPRPGANDNASGPSTLLEAARVLNQLIQDGKIARPRRNIRFLLMPEMTGTHVYVHMHPKRIQKTIAALNLDMVGADQAKTGSVMTIEKPSRSLPSYAGELVYEISKEVVQDASNMSEMTKFSTTNVVLTAFSGGSDHYILSDPSVGVPCPMMGTWPDRYYHTSLDTVDKIDPKMMENVGITTCTYLYWLANAAYEDVVAFAGKLTGYFSQSLAQVTANYLTGDVSWTLAKGQLAFLRDRHLADVRSMQKLISPENQKSWEAYVQSKTKQIDALYKIQRMELQEVARAKGEDFLQDHSGSGKDPLLSKVFVRKYPGPIEFSSIRTLTTLSKETLATYQREEAKEPKSYTLTSLLQYWMDGQRSLREVMDLVEWESGVRNVPFTLAYVQLLLETGYLIEVKT